MKRIINSKFFWGVLIFFGFGYYFLKLSEFPKKIAGSSKWIRIEWQNAIPLISKDCLPISEEKFQSLDDYVNENFEFTEEDSLVQLDIENNQKCILILVEHDNPIDGKQNGKIEYETIFGTIKEVFVKKF